MNTLISLLLGIAGVAAAWFLYDLPGEHWFRINGFPVGPLQVGAGVSALFGIYNLRMIAGTPKKKEVVLQIGRFSWDKEELCRGISITGRVGSGKTADAIVPIVAQIKERCPQAGIFAIDSKGALWEPIYNIARALNHEDKLRLLKVRPDQAPASWKPRWTLNLFEDDRIPSSAFAKLIADSAKTGEKGGGENPFFPVQATAFIGYCIHALRLTRMPVHFANIYALVNEEDARQQILGLLKKMGGADQTKAEQCRLDMDNILKLPPETLGGVLANARNYLMPYQEPEILEVFSPSQPTMKFADIDQGCMICVSIPQRFPMQRRYIQSIMRIMFYYHAMSRFDLTEKERKKRPLIIGVYDEDQKTAVASDTGVSDYNSVDEIRQAGACIIAATQSPVSYEPVMGKEKARTYLLNLSTKIIFTAADEDGAKMLADCVGKIEKKKRSWGYSGGKSSTNYQTQIEHILGTEKLRSLPKHTAVIVHPEDGWQKLHMPYTAYTAPSERDPLHLEESDLGIEPVSMSEQSV